RAWPAPGALPLVPVLAVLPLRRVLAVAFSASVTVVSLGSPSRIPKYLNRSSSSASGVAAWALSPATGRGSSGVLPLLPPWLTVRTVAPLGLPFRRVVLLMFRLLE